MLFGDPYNPQPAKGSRLDEEQGEARAARGSGPQAAYPEQEVVLLQPLPLYQGLWCEVRGRGEEIQCVAE